VQSLRGSAVPGQQKLAGAESFVPQGYRGLKKREAKLPKEAKLRFNHSDARLIVPYDHSGKEAEVPLWQKELEEIKSRPK
jgi:hypothetical protein